jgi:UDP-glucuronate decarboxylase
MVQLMENTTGCIGPVNLGNPAEFTIRQLAEKVLILIPESTSKLVFKPLPSDDPMQRKPDISLAEDQLSWAPKVPLDEGLTKTIDYFRLRLRSV